MFFSFLTSWVSTKALKLNFLILSRLKNTNDFLILSIFLHLFLDQAMICWCFRLLYVVRRQSSQNVSESGFNKGVIINTNGARLPCIASTLQQVIIGNLPCFTQLNDLKHLSMTKKKKDKVENTFSVLPQRPLATSVSVLRDGCPACFSSTQLNQMTSAVL